MAYGGSDMNHKKDIASLVFTLIDSTCTFTALHIDSEKSRFAYVRAMSRCLNLCSDEQNRNDIEKMRTALWKLRKEASKSLLKRYELFGRTNYHYMLGIQQSIEVVESIHIRFEKGHSWTDEHFVRSILGGKKHEV